MERRGKRVLSRLCFVTLLLVLERSTDRGQTYSTPVITSRRRKRTNPCIMVFLVSGPRTTPPPLTPALAAPVEADVGCREAVAAAGADDSSNPDNVEGS